MRQAQGDGNVANATVNPNHTCAVRKRICQRIEPHDRPDPGIVKLRGDGLAVHLLRGIAVHHCNGKPAVVEASPDLDPRNVRPLLVNTGRAMHQRDKGLARYKWVEGNANDRLWNRRQRALQQAIFQCVWHGITQRLGAEQARPLDRVDIGFEPDGDIGHPTRGHLKTGAVRLIGHCVTTALRRALCQPGHQRRLTESLQIDDRIVGLGPQLRLEGNPLLARQTTPGPSTPASQFAGDDTRYALAATNQGRKRALHHPIDFHPRDGAANVLHSGHRVHNIP